MVVNKLMLTDITRGSESQNKLFINSIFVHKYVCYCRCAPTKKATTQTLLTFSKLISFETIHENNI